MTQSLPKLIFHESLLSASEADFDFPSKVRLKMPKDFLPNDITLDLSKAMHYAAYRWHQLPSFSTSPKWPQLYFDLRNKIVVGNQKLAYKAVNAWHRHSTHDPLRNSLLYSDATVTLIVAASSFNPWKGVKFSTYAYTSIIRRIARDNQKFDFLATTAPLDAFPDIEPSHATDPSIVNEADVGHFLSDDNKLLSAREKLILRLRYFGATYKERSLRAIGEIVDISTERVRQIQERALNKIRDKLHDTY